MAGDVRVWRVGSHLLKSFTVDILVQAQKVAMKYCHSGATFGRSFFASQSMRCRILGSKNRMKMCWARGV